MPSIKFRITTVGLAAAVGAGLASALLALMPAIKGSGMLTAAGGMTSVGAAAWGMACIAPLPIMIAAFGFGSLAGLVATVVGAVAVGLVDLRPDSFASLHLDKIATGGLATLVFAVGFGVPSSLLARLAVLPVPTRPSDGKPSPRPEEIRLGLVVAAAAGFAVVSTALSVAITSGSRGSLQAFLDASATAVEPLLAQRGTLPSGVDLHRVALAVVRTLLSIMTGAELLLLLLNLWVAARIAQVSGLLSAPWPDIPGGLRVPRPLAIVLAVALGLSVAGGSVGTAGLIVSGALAMAFALQGLAVIHAITRGMGGIRFLVLATAYVALFGLLPPLSVIPYALLGLVDTAVSFRDRQKPTVKKIP